MTTDGKYPCRYIRDSAEIEAIRKFIKMGVMINAPDGSEMSEEYYLQKLLLQNPHMTFGIQKQEPDPRDKPVSFSVPAVPDTVTQSDLSPFESPVEYQGEVGSCFAQTVVGDLEIFLVRRREFVDLSRRFNFYTTHMMSGTLGKDVGATLRNTVKSLAKYGVPLESSWPYDVANIWDKPPQSVWDEALTRRIDEYQSANDGDVMQARGLLAMGHAIIAGFDIYPEFLQYKVETSGMVPDVSLDAPGSMGHAMLIVGFDDNKVSLNNEMGMFKLRNSWGKTWGDRGHCWISYRYFHDHSWDSWIILKD